MLGQHQIMAAYSDACRMEIEALKPGNVHRFAEGHRMTARQFIESADVTASPVSTSGASVGQRILNAVTATKARVGTNTNLGILLLCGPLAKAAEREESLSEAIREVLQTLDDRDARDVFAAITLANPGGLGEVDEHDVSEPPKVSLLQAMREAAHRDMIAKQYATEFADILGGGLAEYQQAIAAGEQGMWPTVFVYMFFLARFPDSHIARKHGSIIAEDIRSQAAEIRLFLEETKSPDRRQQVLMDFDTALKSRDINPGTSADLTVATLFAANLNFALHNGNVNA